MKVMVSIIPGGEGYAEKHLLCDVQDIYFDNDLDCLVIETGKKTVCIDVGYENALCIIDRAVLSDVLELTHYRARYAD